MQMWKFKAQNCPSNMGYQTKLWKKVWNLKIIHIHKMFFPLILSNVLPLRIELVKRGIRCCILCPRCNIRV